MAKAFEHSFGVGTDNYVKRILFSRSMEQEGVKVEANYGWTPEEQGLRPFEWTDEDIAIEYEKCDQKVRFADLLRKRHAKRIGRGATPEVVKPFLQENIDGNQPE